MATIPAKPLSSPPREATPAPTPAASLLGNYQFERFVSHPTWIALERILLSKGGGTYALSGPRGAGKTWVMERAGTWAEQEGGLMVSFPSPSEYEPTAFLASISEVVANRYERYYDHQTQATTKTASLRFRRRALASVALIYVFLAVAVYGFFANSASFDDRAIRQFVNPYVLLGVGGAVGCLLFLQYVRREYMADREGLRLVKRKAEDLREKVHYAATLKESAEVGLQGTATGVVARLKRASERQLVERPATLSSLIQAFRDFVELMASSVEGPVIIAVDELDKMSDPVKVAQLLRDIKGICDIRGTSFLVSLSNEAARSLDLGGVRTRNEFNSSFYAVFTLSSLPPDECVKLLRRRVPTFSAELGTVAGILGAGVPREVVRIGELISAHGVSAGATRHAVGTALRVEVQAFLAEALAMAAQSHNVADDLGAVQKVALYATVQRLKLEAPTAVELTGALRSWSLNEESDFWRAHFEEEWRRLLVRIAVGGLLIGRPSDVSRGDVMARLQSVITKTASSSAVGLIELGAYVDSAVFAPRDGLCPPSEARLAAYLLSHDAGKCRHGDVARFGLALDDHATGAALTVFGQRGTIERRGFVGPTTWRLSDAAKTSLRSWRDEDSFLIMPSCGWQDVL